MIEAFSTESLVAFAALVVLFLWLDLRQHKEGGAVSIRNAAIWSTIWVSVAMAFAGYIAHKFGTDHAAKFVAGYLLEESLSVDNLFVFMAIFASFGIRDEFQHRILYYGILGAIVLRLLFVSFGTTLLLAGNMSPTAHSIVYTLFGVAVLWAGVQMFLSTQRDEEQDPHDYENHWAVRLTRRFFPVHPKREGQAFFVKVDGKWKATPLFLCLMVVEASDVAFAFDSVPAVIAVTKEPFLVYTSNIFAILGLRSMYFLLAAARRFLVHLEKAVIGILGFIGIKLLIEGYHTQLEHLVGRPVDISPTASLMVVLGGLVLGVLASLIWPPPKEAPNEAAAETN